MIKLGVIGLGRRAGGLIGAFRPAMWDGLRSVYACLAAGESAIRRKFVSARQVER